MPGRDAAAQAGQPLAEPGQPAAARSGVPRVHAVVVHAERHRARGARGIQGVKLDRAGGGVAVADDVGGALADHPAQGGLHVSRKARRVADDAAAHPRGTQDILRAGQLGAEVGGAVSADDRAHFPQRVMGYLAHLEHLPGGVLVAPARQLRGELALDGYQGQVPAEHVVQVAGEAQPLLGDRQAGVLGPGPVELGHDPQRRRGRAAGEHADADDEGVEQGCRDEELPVGAGAGPADACGQAAGRGRAHQEQGGQRAQAEQGGERHNQGAAEEHGYQHAHRDRGAGGPGEGREGRRSGEHAGRGQRGG